MKIEIWSDYVCPFCYIGKRHLEKALKETAMDKKAEIIYRSFELDPQAKKHYDKNINQLISEKYRMTLEKATEMNNKIIESAKKVGLNYNFDDLQPCNTFDAHRLAHYAKSEGKLSDFTEVIMKSYFIDSLNISDVHILENIALEVGLDNKKALKLLESNEFTAEVRKDESQAHEKGATGVPFFLFEGQKSLYGAQPVEYFVQIINELKSNN